MNGRKDPLPLAGMAGRFAFGVREVVAALAIVLMQVSAIFWLYFNHGERRFSVAEAVLAFAVVVLGCWYVLREELRIVVIDQSSIVSRGPFGVFRQEIALDEIEGFRVGGLQGIKIDIEVRGGSIRLIGNRRFFEKIVEEIENIKKRSAQPDGRPNAAEPPRESGRQ